MKKIPLLKIKNFGKDNYIIDIYMYVCIYLLTSTRPFFIFLTLVPNFNVCKDSEPNFSVGNRKKIQPRGANCIREQKNNKPSHDGRSC